MEISRQSLKNILENNVGEVVFPRRILLPNRTSIRKMLCTLDSSILNSNEGIFTLNFRPPKKMPAYNAADKNLLCVWDILMQDWRMVNMNNCNLTQTINRENFWKYFREQIYPMTIEQKISYMQA